MPGMEAGRERVSALFSLARGFIAPYPELPDLWFPLMVNGTRKPVFKSMRSPLAGKEWSYFLIISCLGFHYHLKQA